MSTLKVVSVDRFPPPTLNITSNITLLRLDGGSVGYESRLHWESIISNSLKCDVLGTPLTRPTRFLHWTPWAQDTKYHPWSAK